MKTLIITECRFNKPNKDHRYTIKTNYGVRWTCTDGIIEISDYVTGKRLKRIDTNKWLGSGCSIRVED